MKHEPKRVRAATTAGHVRTSVSLPAALHHDLMLVALETHIVFTELARRALADWLARYNRQHRRTRRAPR